MTRTERHRRWAKANREHLRAYQRRWRAANKDRVREYNKNHRHYYDPVKARAKALRRKFGITQEQYEAMRAAQKNRCAICATNRPGGKGDWHVDHDHRTKRVRGLLCQNCNVGLGNFKDSPERLRSAAKYLKLF